MQNLGRNNSDALLGNKTLGHGSVVQLWSCERDRLMVQWLVILGVEACGDALHLILVGKQEERAIVTL